MWLIDKLADRHITDAIDRGELDGLPVRVNHLNSMMTAWCRKNCGPGTGC